MLLLLSISSPALGAIPDTPFPQPLSKKFELPKEAKCASRLCIDRDGIVYILSKKGVFRLFGDILALDRSYRPLASRIPIDLTVSEGSLYYLYPDEILSNRRSGKDVRKLAEAFSKAAVNSSGDILFARDNDVFFFRDNELQRLETSFTSSVTSLCVIKESFIALSSDQVARIDGTNVTLLASGDSFTSLTPGLGGVVLGTTNGFLVIDPEKGRQLLSLQTRLPAKHITALAVHDGNLWAAATRGVWRRSTDGKFRYFASKRWLDDDHVLDLAVAPGGEVFALTATGLNRISFRSMTLAEKAAHYDEKIRHRHIRYGFCAELRLQESGDITTAEMIDTDNDGTWSNYYMASQAFRFAATGDERARFNAWETFEALERLESINTLGGFPGRTFERVGFKVSDPDRWHPVGDGVWDWKSHTSSDEIIAHAFGSSVLYELAARSPEEKRRIATFIGKITDHIIRNNWYLIDVDGKPTLWGRWNPEYVNAFPTAVFDRRLNSAEIIGLLQFAHRITGKQVYREKAEELLQERGYLENILLPMSRIGTSPVAHMGITMGNEWNHSDDLLAFDSYWVLYRYAFTDELRAKYAAAVSDHWNLERVERNPLWNFIYASTGAADFDPEGALWTLRHFPLDMIDWTVRNSHRQDITLMPDNFREQQLEELLPPDERRITRWNGQPFILDGGSGGSIELAGDEFLLPYWMGRYLRIIE